MTFRYPLPESSPESRWSGFSDEARTSLSRIAMTPSAADQLLTPDGSENTNQELSTDDWNWAASELLDRDASFDKWHRYRSNLGIPVPSSVNELAANNPNFALTIPRLHRAKEAFTASGEVTPEGQNLGEIVSLTLVPWQEMRNHLHDFNRWVKSLRDTQGAATSDDYINEHLLSVIKNNEPLYRDPNSPFQFLTSSEYLDRKIAEDGPWGVMLAQTSREAGTESFRGQSPDQMTENGSRHLEVEGYTVDSMGVFEWIALTLEKDPQELSPQDASWLLANRMTVDGDPRVPYGNWYDGQVRSYLNWADSQNDSVRPRLAVM